MWISKKKWNRMCNKVADLKYLVNQLDVTVEKLSKAHDEVNGETLFSYNMKTGIRYRQDSSYTHKVPTTSTNLIPNVTLEELAKLVIDGTPIERDEKLDVKMKYYGRKD